MSQERFATSASVSMRPSSSRGGKGTHDTGRLVNSRQDDSSNKLDRRRLRGVLGSTGDLKRVDAVLKDGLWEVEKPRGRGDRQGQSSGRSGARETDVTGADDRSVPALEVHVVSILVVITAAM